MEIIQLLWAEENYIFSAAIFIMLGIAILEGTLTLIGAGISSAVDNLFPNVDISIDMPSTEIHSFTELFGWINKGRVPVLMLFILFLTSFGLIGLGLQYVTLNKFSQFVMLVPAILISLPIVRYTSVILNKVMPKDESTAVSTVTFIGKLAEITNGTARKGFPTEAKLKDDFNETHYIMVEPKYDNESFTKGDRVLILSQNNHLFYVTEESIKN